MAQGSFLIHEEVDTETESQAVTSQEMSSKKRAQAQMDDETDAEESEESEDEIDETVAEDMRRLEESFAGISKQYRLINRIGEGTFSTVYKAVDLRHNDEWETSKENNDVDIDAPVTKRRKTENLSTSQPSPVKRKPAQRFVALKKIYVTSSPMRIQNELELLHDLRGCPSVCPLLTAFRHQDQVIAVLPYFRHLDFRIYYREFLVDDMRYYFRSLFTALHAVHKHNILHRDIKPTNFLYDHSRREGVLVDFGLAERQGTDWQPCLCLEHSATRRHRYMNSFAAQQPTSTGYPNPKHDQRPSKRANRAGTRGFRAPEVLLKCTSQTTRIDIWSAGVILLTLLARRFPFFNSADDVDAMIELSSIFGRRRMKAVAALHGSVFETNIETVGEKGYTWEKIILWASCREKEPLSPAEQQAIRFLNALLELDPTKRLSAKEALQHEFLSSPILEENTEVVHEEQHVVNETS